MVMACNSWSRYVSAGSGVVRPSRYVNAGTGTVGFGTVRPAIRGTGRLGMAWNGISGPE